MKSVDSYLSKIKNKKLLVVYPHPDDESVMAGGIILRAKALGFWVTVLTLTEGGRGKIHVSGKGRSVSEIRRGEMAGAMSYLGVADWVMWKFDDGRLRKTSRWKERLRRFINETDPGLVVTYDLSGVTGHPDHIAQAVEVLREYKRVKKFGLLWTSFDRMMAAKMVNSRVYKYLRQPSLELELSLPEAVKKWLAVFAHKSQNLGSYVGRPWWKLALSRRKEWYSEAVLDQMYKYSYVKFKI